MTETLEEKVKRLESVLDHTREVLFEHMSYMQMQQAPYCEDNIIKESVCEWLRNFRKKYKYPEPKEPLKEVLVLQQIIGGGACDPDLVQVIGVFSSKEELLKALPNILRTKDGEDVEIDPNAESWKLPNKIGLSDGYTEQPVYEYQEWNLNDWGF